MNGLVPKEKKSGGRANNSKAYAFEDIEQTVAFVTQYAEHHALVFSGRIPSFRRADVKLLPSAETKSKVYAAYSTYMKDSGMVTKKYVNIFITINVIYLGHIAQNNMQT